ncbi:MAG: sigma-70 family RNA polymerase sigma factor [Caulobacterales bacterium]
MGEGLDRAEDCRRVELTALIPQMRAFARSLCGDPADADDLAQVALLSAWRHREDYNPGTNMKAWVFMILRNQFYSDRRRTWRLTPLDQRWAEGSLTAVSNPDAALELDEVRRAMLQLPDEQREALTLIAVAGLTYDEVGAISHCAAGTIKSRVNRARQRLLALLSRGVLTDRSQVAGGAMTSLIAEAARLSKRADRRTQENAVQGAATASTRHSSATERPQRFSV